MEFVAVHKNIQFQWSLAMLDSKSISLIGWISARRVAIIMAI